MANNKSAGTVFEGSLEARGLKFGIVCARFNDFFVSRLLDGAMDAIVRHGGDANDVSVAYVPGSYEIPFAIKKMLRTEKYDAILALGVVIQGATAQRVNHLQIALCVMPADVVGFAGNAPGHGQMQRPRVILHIEPVADLRAVAVNRQRLVIERTQDHQRDQLFRELARAVIIGTVGHQRRHPERPEPCAHQMVA